MPLLFAALGLLLSVMDSVVGRVLIALGIGFVTYSGFDVAIGWLLDFIKANFSGMPSDVLSFLAWLWVDKAIGMMFSAYSVAIGFKLAGSTTLRKMVQK